MKNFSGVSFRTGKFNFSTNIAETSITFENSSSKENGQPFNGGVLFSKSEDPRYGSSNLKQRPTPLKMPPFNFVWLKPEG